MKRRYTVLAAVIMAFALLVAACGDSEGGDTTTTQAGTEETTTTAAETTTTAAETTTTTAALPPLLVWADANQAPAVQAASGAFTDATGVAVNVEIVDRGVLKDEVISKAAAGEGPDIFVGAHDWIGELASNGVVAPIDLGGRSDDFLAKALTAMRWDGEQYGMPFVTEAIALYYNADLITEPPTTMEELTASCDALESGIECLVVQGGNDAGDAYHHQPFITAFGGQIFAFSDDTGFDGSIVTLDSEETVAGAALLEQLVTDGYVPSVNDSDASSLFYNGQAAYWISGPWQLGNLENPDTNVAAQNWAVTTLPTVDGTPMAPHVGIQGFYVSAYAKNLAIAQAFLLEYVATDEVMQALFDADPRGSAYKSVLAGLDDDPVYGTFARSGANGTYMPNIPEMGSVWGPVGDNFLLLRNGELDAATAMANAQEQVVNAIAGG